MKDVLKTWAPILLLLLFNSLGLSAWQTTFPQIQFERYAEEQGLYSANIFSIAQDHLGFIWLGASGVLYRFDGRRFVAFQHDPDDPYSLPNANVRFIYEDREHTLWVVCAGEGLTRLDRKTGRFITYRKNPDDPNSLSSNDLSAVLEDSRGAFWITGSSGLDLMDRKEESFHNIKAPSELLSHPKAIFHVSSIAEDSKGNLWMGTLESDLLSFDPVAQVFEAVRLPYQDQNLLSVRNVWIESITEDLLGQLWVSTSTGLFTINLANKQARKFQPWLENPNLPVFDKVFIVYTDRAGNIWVGLRTGLLQINPQSGLYEHFQHDPKVEKSIPSGRIRSLLQDRQGNFWIGTTGAGLCRLSATGNRAQFYHMSVAEAANSSNTKVTCINGGPNDEIWIGDHDGNFYHFNPNSRRLSSFTMPVSDEINSRRRLISAIAAVSTEKIWLGLSFGGVQQYDLSANQFSDPKSTFSEGLNIGNNINVLFKDSRGDIWISFRNIGLCYLNAQTGAFELFQPDHKNPNSIPNTNILYIMEDQKGDVWLATGGDGLSRITPATRQIINYKHEAGNANTISHNDVYSLFQDSKGQIWIGTKAGLDQLDPLTGAFKHFPAKQTDINDIIMSLQEDDQGFLWLGAGSSLHRFDRENNIFRKFDKIDGLQHFNYIPSPAVKHKKTGRLFFGTERGLLEFQPADFEINDYAPPSVFSRMTYHYANRQDERVDDLWIANKKTVRLSYQTNIIEFEFAALNYHQAQKNQYVYMLEGAGNQWIDLGNQPNLRFTNLSPGHYTLRVKGANNDGIWSEEEARLKIIVVPPWWATIWAYALYAILTAAAVFIIYRFQLTRQLEKRETQRLKELDAFKNRLYTNITHEFRTPLTVIKGMTDRIAGHQKEKRLIQLNNDNLLNLVNQILDLRKIESGKMTLNLLQGDVVLYLKSVLASFRSLAEGKGIDLRGLYQVETLIMDYDKEKLLRIMSNLLSNALKFTPAGGEVCLMVSKNETQFPEEEGLEIKIRDTGIGISEEKLPYIFDRFYQVESEKNSYHNRNKQIGEGTGIGLALTKELVKLMKGVIEVESKVEVGSVFRLVFPIRRSEGRVGKSLKTDKQVIRPAAPILSIDYFANTDSQNNTLAKSNLRRPRLLIVEDNLSIVEYLKTLLNAHYQIDTAFDGQAGLEQALKQIPDLIISDVMMPRKDGFELCETLKKDQRTSHIPIILLTAKADVESRLAGLERGADAYLAKPFNQKELFIRLEKLLALRRRLQKRYQTFETLPTTKNDAFKQEDAFILAVKQKIEAQLSNENFGIQALCKSVGMSRSQLHLKLKALTNKSTSHFIRSVRLYKAKELLQTSNLNITQVSFEVGFKDANYFTRTFTKEFGASPKSFRKK